MSNFLEDFDKLPEDIKDTIKQIIEAYKEGRKIIVSYKHPNFWQLMEENKQKEIYISIKSKEN
jgi:hypothetical protein